MTEKTLLNNIQLALSTLGARVFRNNVGTGWVGRVSHPKRKTTVTVGVGDVVIRNARPLHAGLCKGSSDLIGWKSILITPEMVGRRIAVFSALEIKTGVVPTTQEQQNFITAVNQAGGRAGVVRSETEAAEVIGAV